MLIAATLQRITQLLAQRMTLQILRIKNPAEQRDLHFLVGTLRISAFSAFDAYDLFGRKGGLWVSFIAC
ncbi:hypothetical protein TUM4433_26670 [Shewanella schlegeliana]|nr:hypothetical protein TUM4433_26670 [Shewanella schlegeliana]